MSLYVFGSNTMSQLGLPEDISTTHVPTKLPFFEGKNILKVACGKLHTLVLCSNNELYSWGVNDDFALGRGGDEEFPALVPFKKQIVDICGGASFSALLTSDGQVFACGTFKSTSGIMGFSEKVKFQPIFTRYKGLKGIEKISAGQNHIVMVDRRGNLWAVGANESNQLGYTSRPRNPKRCLIPTQISNRKPNSEDNTFVKVEGGGFHTIAINAAAEGFGWGSNFNGQLANKTNVPSEERTKMEISDLKDVSCGLNHTLILTHKNSLYGAGDNSLSQLGLNAGKTVNDPQLIVEHVDKVKAGCDFTIIQSGNKLFGWGSNLSGEVGFEEEEVKSMQEIPFDFGNIIDFDCGSDFTVVATK